MPDKNLIHYAVVTGILMNKDGKFLVVKRADWEKAFPGRWTVPGGKLEVLDYALRDKDTPHHWYNIFENLLKREVSEEVGIEIENIDYVTSMVYIRPDKIPCLIVSLFADAITEKIKLCNALTEYKWVDLDEAKDFDLIEGIYDELIILDKKLKGEKILWEGKNL
ncbi:MAG: NUDIX domain-containing protein [Candidatus Nanoarchaeia archaeon]|nr:NUDIX domain-containing protein [Candidatus Nanoarchaeia archaeon]MDD5358037.1 NUDIX domain-containing protein [Candidatus Nanoarchaeia archaeon]MDD5588956.1 NUDIX domain-containing protein [Candidatus Nanoarchaeia archaeon]